MVKPRTCHSLRWNLPLINFGGNKLASASQRVLSKNSNFQTFISYVPTPRPAFDIALALAIPNSNNKLFKKFIKAYLRPQIQLLAPFPLPVQPKPWEQLFKARFSKLYIENSYTEYYNFCQKCEDYFKIARAITSNRVSFATSFL